MLLFWPCAWGLTLAYDFTNDYKLYFFYLLLFFALKQNNAASTTSLKLYDNRFSENENRWDD